MAVSGSRQMIGIFLLYRPKTFSDESLPAGNAVAAFALLRLGHLCAEPRYLDAAERTVKAALPSVNSYPEAHASMLQALQDALEPPTMVVVRGKADKLLEWQTYWIKVLIHGGLY